MPALAAPYGAMRSEGRVDSPELTLTITPRVPDATIARASAWQQCIVTSRFCSTIPRSHSSSASRNAVGARPPIDPTLLTATAERAERGLGVGDRRPHRVGIAQVGHDGVDLGAPAVAVVRGSLGQRRRRRRRRPSPSHPARASHTAVARPIPMPAPVTSACFPVQSQVDAHGSNTTLMVPWARSAATRNASVASARGKRCVTIVSAISGRRPRSAAATSTSRPAAVVPVGERPLERGLLHRRREARHRQRVPERRQEHHGAARPQQLARPGRPRSVSRLPPRRGRTRPSAGPCARAAHPRRAGRRGGPRGAPRRRPRSRPRPRRARCCRLRPPRVGSPPSTPARRRPWTATASGSTRHACSGATPAGRRTSWSGCTRIRSAMPAVARDAEDREVAAQVRLPLDAQVAGPARRVGVDRHRGAVLEDAGELVAHHARGAGRSRRGGDRSRTRSPSASRRRRRHPTGWRPGRRPRRP